MFDGRLLAIGTFALLLPVSIENPAAPDSAVGGGGETRISVIGAVGSYAIIDRGCEGQVIATHPHEFTEAGIEVSHRFPNNAAIGVRSGVVRDRSHETLTDYSVVPYRDSLVEVKDDVTYYNPYVAHEGRVGGIGAGWILSSGDFGNEGNKTVLPWSAHIRLGRLDGPFFRIGVMEGFPLYTGGGYAEAGLGMRASPVVDVYAGVTGGPYDGPGLMVKLDWRVQTNFAVMLRGRAGNSGGEPQNGIGLGISYVSAPPVALVRGSHKNQSGGIESSWGLAPKHPPAEKDTTAKDTTATKP